MKILENIFGTIALVSTIVGILPQVYKSYKTKSTNDVSLIMLWNCLVCSVSWTIYGFITSSKFVTWSNGVNTIIAIVSIIQKNLYDTKE